MNIWKKQCLDFCCCCVSLNTGVVIILVITLLLDALIVWISTYMEQIYFIVSAAYFGVCALIWIITIVGICLKKAPLVLCGEICYVVHAGMLIWQTFDYFDEWHTALVIFKFVLKS